jgi:hypothetical protein
MQQKTLGPKRKEKIVLCMAVVTTVHRIVTESFTAEATVGNRKGSL